MYGDVRTGRDYLHVRAWDFPFMIKPESRAKEAAISRHLFLMTRGVK
jgi:hypothetical protein